jgi:hypothetical protein
MTDEIIINHGDGVKSLADGKIGGYLVLFSDEKSPDLAGDFFTKDTDFGFKDSQKTAVWFNHRKPIKTRDGKQIEVKEKIGEGELKIDDKGVFIEAILYNRAEYEKALGAMGWSSGTAAHLVDREKKGNANFIKTWYLGLDASTTPRPCEPRTSVQSLKSYLDETEEPQTIKGLLNNKLNERKSSTWELWSAFCSLSEDIAKVAASSDLTGVTINVSDKVKEVADELAAMLTASVVEQIEDYKKSSTSERFYLKSNPEVFHNLITGAPHAGRYEDRLEMALGVVERVTKDAKEIHELRQSTKSGAKISTARMTKLKEIMTSLSALLLEVEGEPGKCAEASQLMADFQYQKMLHDSGK